MKLKIDALTSTAAGVAAGDNDWEGADGEATGEGRPVSMAPAVGEAGAVRTAVGEIDGVGADDPAGVKAGDGETLAVPQAAAASAAERRRAVALIM